MTRLLAGLSVALLLVGLVVAISGSALPGVLLIVAGLVIGSVAGAVNVTRRVYRSAREWAELARGGASAVRIVSVEPPPGFLLRRDAVVTLEVEGAEGTSKRVRREMTIPIPQAMMWRLAGRVPTPIGALTEARELDLAVWTRKRT